MSEAQHHLGFGGSPDSPDQVLAALHAHHRIADLALALGMSTDAGRSYLGDALELRYRLPKTWDTVACPEGSTGWVSRLGPDGPHTSTTEGRGPCASDGHPLFMWSVPPGHSSGVC
jgi:hypothetical protein